MDDLWQLAFFKKTIANVYVCYNLFFSITKKDKLYVFAMITGCHPMLNEQ